MSTSTEQIRDDAAVQERLNKLDQCFSDLGERCTALAELNKSLTEAFGTRRKAYLDFIPIMSSAFTMALLLAFAYQVYEGVQVTKQFNEIKEVRRSLELQRDQSSRLVGDLTRSIVLLSNGYRDSARNRELSALRKAEAALAELQEWEPLLRVQLGLVGSKTLSPYQLEQLEAVRPTLNAVQEATVAAYELQGRTSVILYNPKNKELLTKAEEAGRSIEILDKLRWEGPHFTGLALAGRSDYETDASKKAELRQQSEQKLLQAVQLDSKNASVDIINLAEGYFVESRYDDAREFAGRYLSQEGSLAPAEHKLVCSFIANLSDYALESNIDEIKKAFTAIVDVAQNSSRVFKNYSWERLQQLHDEPQAFASVSADKRKLLKLSLKAILAAKNGMPAEKLELEFLQLSGRKQEAAPTHPQKPSKL